MRSDFANLPHRLIRSHPVVLVALVVFCLFIVSALFGPIIWPHDAYESNLEQGPLRPPSLHHPLGTDDLGRDIVARILIGARFSLIVAFTAVCLGLAIGVPIGLITGYLGGKIDMILMRAMDALLAFPSFVLALALAASFGAGLHSVIFAIGLVAVPTYARLVRGQVLATVNIGFVEAARSIGASDSTILFRHVLPNITGPIIVQSTIHGARAILTESSLSFLGVGIQLPHPSWGAMISLGGGYLDIAIWMVVAPAVAIFLAVLSLNLIGDALRDILDPRTFAEG